jgi:hypothetical protein
VNGSRVNITKADAWMAENIDPARQEAARRGRADRVSGGSVASARQQKLETDVRLSQLKLGERDGSLVARSEVEAFVFARARMERDRWVSFVARTAPTLANELDCDPQRAFAVLDRLVREHLTELADAPTLPLAY